jgi:DNA-binding response OmpR family regulator
MQSLRNSAPSALPVIVLTTRAAEDLEGEFHRAGASRLLWKPVSAAELLAAVAEVVN